MRNFKDMVEAAYIMSRRQGHMTRDRDRERSTHEDRRNRYRDERIQAGAAGQPEAKAPRQTMDTWRPAESGYQDVLHDHRGKGPRNYKRSDARIHEMVCDRLSENADIDASNIEVSVKESEVILTGEVNEKFEKRLAEDIAESITGVSNVENRVRVNRRQMV